jgi:hypothetical protein
MLQSLPPYLIYMQEANTQARVRGVDEKRDKPNGTLGLPETRVKQPKTRPATVLTERVMSRSTILPWLVAM